MPLLGWALYRPCISSVSVITFFFAYFSDTQQYVLPPYSFPIHIRYIRET
uniref:Uncharacterized protein n=1 Tax=Arundo donax TaxID=35708 RepID=A0A0A8ZDU4_ARUDO